MVTSDVTCRLQWLHGRLREIVLYKVGAKAEETLEINFFITNLMHKLLVYLHIIH